MLREFAGSAGLDNASAHAARKAHALAFDIGTGFAPNIEGFSVVAKINAHFFQNGFGIAFDDLQAFFVKYFVIGNLARDVRDRLTGARRTRRTLGFPATGGAPVAWGGAHVLCFLNACVSGHFQLHTPY